MLFEIRVDMLDHSRERRRFAATGRACHQYNATGRLGDSANLLQQTQLLEAGDNGFYITHRQAPLTALLEEIRAKPANAWQEIREINLTLLVQAFFQMCRRDQFDDLVNPFLSGIGAL